MSTAIKATPAAEAAWEASVAHAERDLDQINRLLVAPAFQSYFMRRLKERRAAHAVALEGEQTELDTAKLRARIAEIDEILRMPANDGAAHANTLARHRR